MRLAVRVVIALGVGLEVKGLISVHWGAGDTGTGTRWKSVKFIKNKKTKEKEKTQTSLNCSRSLRETPIIERMAEEIWLINKVLK